MLRFILYTISGTFSGSSPLTSRSSQVSAKSEGFAPPSVHAQIQVPISRPDPQAFPTNIHPPTHLIPTRQYKNKIFKTIFHFYLPQFPVIKTDSFLQTSHSCLWLNCVDLFLGAEGPIQVTSGDPPGCAYLVGTLTKRGHLGPGHGECHCSRSKVRERPAPLPEAVGWLAILNRRLELGLPGASRVPWSDLPRTSLGFINKASASVPSNHSMLLQVAVGTREFLVCLFVCLFFERKKEA